MIFSCYSHSLRLRLLHNVFSSTVRNVLVRQNVTASNNEHSHVYTFSFHWWRRKLTNIQMLYDEITGLREVHDAQSRVIDAEKRFVLAQETRRNLQSELSKLQGKLKEIYAELDKTPRGEDRYVQLVTMEHSVIKEEKRSLEVFQQKEREEREYFNALSSAVKMGHEKERAQAERTKYWSIIGSVIGTLIGMLVSTIVNDRRMRELRNIVKNSVNMKMSNEEDFSKLLKDNNCQMELLMSSVKKLSENMYDGMKNGQPIPEEKSNCVVRVLKTLYEKTCSSMNNSQLKPSEQSDSVVSIGLMGALILSAVVIWLFKQ